MPPSALVFFAPSAALFLLAFVLFLPRRSFAQRATRAEGTVVTYAIRQTRSSNDGRRRRRRMHPVVQYVVDGKTHRITGTVGQTNPRYPIGTPLTILHLPDSPADGRIDSATELYFVAILPAIMGAVALVCGFGFLFTNR